MKEGIQMTVLLLGNGFDLYYKLPTNYVNFLHTVKYLHNNDCSNIKFIGDIFSEENLLNQDNFIKLCYQAHQKEFNNTEIDKNKLDQIVTLTKDNYWYKYLLKSFNKDVGWIDFEKEIAFVVESFRTVLQKKQPDFAYGKNENIYRYVINNFDFFVTEDIPQWSLNALAHVKKDYCIEYPLHSGEIMMDSFKIIDFLYKELTRFSNALKLYLECFIDKVVDSIIDQDTHIEAFDNIKNVITFNYTNTFEKLYKDKNVFHIHGNINNEIVLGINPDKYDELDEMDTSFISFKKYHQRVVFETDREYLKWIQMNYDDSNETQYRLIVMGHSLDETDKDIIIELFQKAEEITILYHNDDAKRNYVSNLIKIFGKTNFDLLRKDRNLQFKKLDSGVDELIRELSKK